MWGGNSIDICLQQVPKYGMNAPRIRSDVIQLLSQTPHLRPQTGQFTFETGERFTMIKLDGTIPISYKAATYNIPVAIWLPHRYPRVAPRAMVVPTANMMVKPRHRHVGQDGMVYMPYLNEWNEYRSNLVELVVGMTSIFSKEPPLFQKPPGFNAAAARGLGAGAGVGAGARARAPAPAPAPSTYQMSRPPVDPAAAKEAEKRELVARLTSKIQSRLHEEFVVLRAGIDECFATSRKLEQGKDDIAKDVFRLTEDHQQLTTALAQLAQQDAELTAWLTEHEKSSTDLDLDKVVKPADVLSKQAFDLVASSAAYDDLFYHLSRGLSNGVIKQHIFLKRVRANAEKQFLDKALAMKVMREQMRLSKSAGRGR